MVDKFDIKQVRLLAERGDAYSQDMLNAYAQGLNDFSNDVAGEVESIRKLAERFDGLADYHAGMTKKWRLTWLLSIVLVAAFSGLWVWQIVDFLGGRS